MMSGSPMFLFFKPASGSCTNSSWFPDVSSLIASPLSTISCSILARHSSGCCPNPAQPGHPAAHPYLTKMFCRKYNLFARWRLANSSLCWIVGPCCVLHNVFSLLTDWRQRHRIQTVRSSLPTKTPRIHLMFNLAPSSEWFRTKHSSPNGTTSPV